MKVNRLKLPAKGKVDTYFIAGDWHSLHVDAASCEILLQLAQRVPKKRRKLVINGDFVDAEHLMKRGDGFKKWIKLSSGIEEYFLPKSEEEYLWANEMLDELQKVFPSITFIEGNHCARYRWFMENHSPAAYRHNFCLKTQLHLRSRNISMINYNDWLDVGNVTITHGMYHGTSAVKKHYEACCGRSVIFSHVHKLECRPFVSRGETRQGWSLPAMCKLNPEYIKNTDNNWSNGFGVLNVKHNGNFNFNTYQIWDDELALLDGTILKG